MTPSRLVVPFLLLPVLTGCAATLDHQAEMILHPRPLVQGAALLGALPGVIVGAPIWGLSTLLFGPDSSPAAYSLHVFAYPGELLLGGIPWLIAGPSW